MTRPRVILDLVAGLIQEAKQSIELDISDRKFHLVGDQDAPGNLKVYGTDSAGDKGYLTKVDYGIDQVDNTSDLNKPISTATQTALNGKLSLTGGTMSGDIAMGSHKVTGLAASSGNGDAVRYEELAAEITNRTSADSTLQTNINAEASTRASADTTLQTNINTEASTRASADTTLQTNINAKVSKAGDTMSGPLAMGNNKVTGVANGTNANDAINKSQLDAVADESTIAWDTMATAGITLTSGWSASSPAVQVRKVRGIVYFRGRVQKSSTPNNGDLIMTLPVGYRPLRTYKFIALSETDSSGFLTLNFDTAGNLIVAENGKTGTNPLTGASAILDNVQFDISH